MGWTFSYEWHDKKDLVSYLTRDRDGYKTLRKCCRGQTLYALHEATHDLGVGGLASVRGEQPLRFIAVYRLSRADGMWGYKAMDESCGPNYYDCPLVYLKEASPAEEVGGYAASWREGVQRRAEDRKKKNSKKPKTGEKWTLVGCTIPHVKIISAQPLRGAYQGVAYRLTKSRLGEKVEEVAAAV
jgi:hypothetical protein